MNHAAAQRELDCVTNAKVVLVGERFADQHVVSSRKQVHDAFAVAGKKTQVAGARKDAGLAGAERGGESVVADRVGAKAVHGGDFVQGFYAISNIGIERRMAVNARGAGRPKIEVRGQAVFQPYRHRIAKAAHHDADAHHHSHGG